MGDLLQLAPRATVSPPERASKLPPRSLPVVYFGYAHLALVAALLLVALRPQELSGFFYHAGMFTGVHLVTLGFITCSILGATWLVAPFALRTNLEAQRLDAWICGGVLVGVSGVVSHFWLERYPGLVASAAVLVVALALFAWRLLRALRGARIHAGVRLLVRLAWINLLLATLVGLLLGVNKSVVFLPGVHMDWVFGHVHLAAVGWTVMMVVGVGYRLLPMFLPAVAPAGRSLFLCATLIETGLIGLALALPLAPRAARPFALLVVAGLTVFFFDVARMLNNRRRPAAHLPFPDLGMLHAFQSLAYLLLSAGIGSYLVFADGWQLGAIMVYGVFGLLGFLSQMVLGMETRLLPMHAWTAALHRGGLAPSDPPPHRMPWRTVQYAVFVLWTLGVPLLALGLARDRVGLVAAGGWTLSAAAILAGVNVARVLRHAYPVARG